MKRIFFQLLLCSAFLFLCSKSHAEDIVDFSGLVIPAISIDNLPYKEVDTQTEPSVMVMGRMGKLFIEGNRIGYMVNRSSFGALSVVGQIRTHQYTPEDFAFGERKKAAEVGLQLAKPIAMGWTAQASFFADVSDTHQGQEFELSAFRRYQLGDFRLLTLLAAQQQSSKLTSYYGSTTNYQADADLNLEFELIGTYKINDVWNAVAVYRHYFHGDGLANSPLVDSDTTSKLSVGIGYRF